MGLWVPTDIQAITVRVDPRAALPYMARVTLEDITGYGDPQIITGHGDPQISLGMETHRYHWVWTPTDITGYGHPQISLGMDTHIYHWVWTPIDHICVPRAIAATVGPCSRLTQEAGPDHPRVHWAAKISSLGLCYSQG